MKKNTFIKVLLSALILGLVYYNLMWHSESPAPQESSIPGVSNIGRVNKGESSSHSTSSIGSGSEFSDTSSISSPSPSKEAPFAGLGAISTLFDRIKIALGFSSNSSATSNNNRDSGGESSSKLDGASSGVGSKKPTAGNFKNATSSKNTNAGSEKEYVSDDDAPVKTTPAASTIPDDLGQPIDAIKKASLEAQNNFSSASQLTVPFPEELQYVSLDLDEGIETISGYNVDLGVNLSISAKAGNFGAPDAEAFLDAYGANIPGYNTNYTAAIKNTTPQRVTVPSSSGLNSPYVWTIQSGSQTATVVLVQRADGQGSYIAVMTGPTSYFNNNEDRYDAIYTNIKTKP